MELLIYLCLLIGLLILFAVPLLVKCAFDLCIPERQGLKATAQAGDEKACSENKNVNYVFRLMFVHVEVLRLRFYVWKFVKEPYLLYVIVQYVVISVWTSAWTILFMILKQSLIQFLVRFLHCYSQYYRLPYFGHLTLEVQRNLYNPEGKAAAQADSDEKVENENACEDQFKNRVHFFDHTDLRPIKCPAVKLFASLREHWDDVMATNTTHNGTGTLAETWECRSVDPTYVVLLSGNQTKKLRTKTFASLPRHNKFLINEKVQDSSGATRIKLILKLSHERYKIVAISHAGLS